MSVVPAPSSVQARRPNLQTSNCTALSGRVLSVVLVKMLSLPWLRVHFLTYTTCLCTAPASSTVYSPIDRQSIVQKYSPTRHNTSQLAYDTPMMLGNGRLGFGADITGLQSLLPFNILSSWAWHNDSLPLTANQTSSSDFVGLEWDVHGRQVEYAQPNPDLPEISQWMIANPHRINLGRIGLGVHGDWLTEEMLSDAEQKLDLLTGSLTSKFKVNGEDVCIKTAVDPQSDTIGVEIQSQLLMDGTLAVLVDYPYASGENKFDAPFAGVWNPTDAHTTDAEVAESRATIHHRLDATSYENLLTWEGPAMFSAPATDTHRYSLAAKDSSTLALRSTFSPSTKASSRPSTVDVFTASASWWETYWRTGAFIAFPAEAEELQRRTILSQYLLAVNSADSDFLTQESGLVNNGWYGKFHMEMIVWHNMHYLLWAKPQYVSQMLPGMYQRFLATSLARAREMGYNGARWGKMSDPSGRSAPGEINSLLIWQQPHPMFFADQEYRLATSPEVRDEILRKWAPILEPTADFMASFAWWNASTERYDLGRPMYTSSENTVPQDTVNPTFELAYWQFGLQVAADWKSRMGHEVPQHWIDVREKLSPLPTDTVNQTQTYVIYEGIPDMWNNETYSKYEMGHSQRPLLTPRSLRSPVNVSLTRLHALARSIHTLRHQNIRKHLRDHPQHLEPDNELRLGLSNARHGCQSAG